MHSLGRLMLGPKSLLGSDQRMLPENPPCRPCVLHSWGLTRDLHSEGLSVGDVQLAAPSASCALEQQAMKMQVSTVSTAQPVGVSHSHPHWRTAPGMRPTLE